LVKERVGVEKIKNLFIVDLKERTEDRNMLTLDFLCTLNFSKQVSDCSLSDTNVVGIWSDDRCLSDSGGRIIDGIGLVIITLHCECLT
jgi:hypothetical protein